jgi:hypothetical protein
VVLKQEEVEAFTKELLEEVKLSPALKATMLIIHHLSQINELLHEREK